MAECQAGTDELAPLSHGAGTAHGKTMTNAPLERYTTRQHLIIDADDTLWENNIHFERAIEDFMDYLAHSSLSRDEVRAVLDEIEIANFRVHGYGSAAFSRNLRATYERLAEREINEDDLRIVMSFGERILSQPIELIEGVEETLQRLVEVHDLTLMTKGQEEEQRLKIDRSGIGSYFRHAEVVPEKDAASYRFLAESIGLDPERTWMIGNSPKSDINPALAAGLNAVFIPHHATWRLEHQEINPSPGSGKLIRVSRFSDLAGIFLP
jgi:putative hydrolase of the HAD superfamily